MHTGAEEGRRVGVERMGNWEMSPHLIRDDRGIPWALRCFPVGLKKEGREASLAMAARGGSGVAPMAGKGSLRPCCEADSPPHPLISGLGLPSAHWRKVGERKWEKGQMHLLCRGLNCLTSITKRSRCPYFPPGPYLVSCQFCNIR